MATLIIDSHDFSAYIKKSDNRAQPVYIDGPAAGNDVDGNPIFDRRTTHYKKDFELNPIPEGELNDLCDLCEESENTVVMTTRLGEQTEVTAQCSVSGYTDSFSYAGTPYYTGITLTVEARHV